MITYSVKLVINVKMVNVKLGHSVVSNCIQFVTSMGQRKKSESPTEFEPMTFGIACEQALLAKNPRELARRLPSVHQPDALTTELQSISCGERSWFICDIRPAYC